MPSSSRVRPTLDELFSAGVIANRPADLKDDSRISFTETYPADKLASVPAAGARIPDAIGWSDDGSTLFTADEGEANFTGGRGWSAHAAGGAVLFDDGGEPEATAVQLGHYPDGRSDAKGIEAESLAIDEYGSREFMFVGSERGAFVAVSCATGSSSDRAAAARLDPAGRGDVLARQTGPCDHLSSAASAGTALSR